MKAKFTLVCLVFLGLACLTHPLVAADTIHDAKDAIQDAGRSAASSIENLWHRIDESRLKNRTRDEIIAWMMMGMLVGGVAGSLTSLATSGLGRVGRILLGLGGAFVGGIIMRFARIDLGWGPILIRYEELLSSLIGAVLLILAYRMLRSRAEKRPE